MTYTSKEHIITALKRGVRADGRRTDEFRPIRIETGLISTAEGSARVKCGDTEILVGIKMALGTPYPDTPDSGVLIVGAELLPLSNPLFEQGPPSIESIEVARVIDRGIRESKTIDEKRLCVTPGELVWMVNVDLCPINTNGNLIDLGGLAAIAALKTTCFPGRQGNKVDYHVRTEERLPVSSTPLPVTVIKVGDVLIVDPTADEFEVADARLTVTTEGDGTICALQKGGECPLSESEISQMIDLAAVKAQELRALLEAALK